VNGRRVLLVVAAFVAGTSIVILVKPFNAPAGLVSDAARSGRFPLVGDTSCRAPIVDAWHGERAPAAEVPGGVNAKCGLHGLFVGSNARVTVCRDETRLRLALSTVDPIAAGVVLAVAVSGRRRTGGNPATRRA
jgi:hypothetical protein